MGEEDAIRRVLDGALDAVIATDGEGTIVGWNRAAETLFGWDKNEALGRKVGDVVVPARDREEFARRLANVRHEETRRHKERTAIDRDGREFPVETAVSAIDADGCWVITAFVRDISERKRAERLRETEHGIARLLAGGPSGRELTAACQPIIGQGLEWATVEGYMLIGEELELVARWGSETRPPAVELAERARRERVIVEDPGAVAAPVVVGGHVLGVTVLRDAPDRTPQNDEIAVFANITRTLAQYGERWQAEQQLQAETLALAEVARAGRRLSMATNLVEARQALCDAARQVCQCSIAFLAEPDPEPDADALIVTAIAGATPRDLDPPPARLGPGTGIHRSYVTGQPIFTRDAQTDPRAWKQGAAATGVHSAIVQPVVQGTTVIAVLGMSWAERIEQTPEYLRLLVGLLADKGAIALSRAEVFTDLASAARTDPLTGLANLRAWDEALARELARAARSKRPLSIAMLDIDGLKEINDQQGHQAGDRALRESVSAWLGVVREGDLVARLGGDEFAVALPDCDRAGAQQLGERLRTATPEGQTCSIGAAEWHEGESAEQLLERADQALYAAKHAGRNRTVAAP